jgi:DNA-binding HxlR family transcriptional regulator
MARKELSLADPWNAACPSREVLAIIGDKWALLLMPVLAEGAKRNGELMRRLSGVSQKMLTQTLRDLQRNGIVVRQDFQEVPPRVEYRLTPLGASLGRVVGALDQWVIDNYRAVESARSAFDKTA